MILTIGQQKNPQATPWTSSQQSLQRKQPTWLSLKKIPQIY